MNDLIQQANDFMTTNSEYGYLLVAVILMIFSLGSFKKYNWAISPLEVVTNVFYIVQWEKNGLVL